MAETEAVLLKRFARTGDAEAFAELTRRHAGLVYGAAWRILSDMDRASDVAQETFLQLTKDATRVTGSLPGWLHRVATRKAIDLVRRDASRKDREVRYAVQQPQEARKWRDISPHVDEGLNGLDPELREILIAHFLEGQSTRQIAVQRGVSQATVSRRLSAGVVQLRRKLRKRGVLVAAVALAALLRGRAVSAAPAPVMTELGKMALAGGHATATLGGTVSGVISGLRAFVGGALEGVKAKAVAAAVVGVTGVGSVVAYQYATRPAIPEATVAAARRASQSPYPAVAGSSAMRGVDASTRGPARAGQDWDEMIAGLLTSPGPGQAGVRPGIPFGPQACAPNTGREMPMVTTCSVDAAGPGACNASYASHHGLDVPGPNDPNDPNETSADD